MRKGLWSPDEDERLVRCITKYVNGSWSDIARKAGLDRCGKSCRRRWMNHLRPDLKRGKFSMDEINLIVQLQEALGNRWSDIASHLEGRTDNDVKNLWNTQIKKRLAQLKAAHLSSSTSHLPPTFNGSSDASGSMHHVPQKIIHMQQDILSNDNVDFFMQSCENELGNNGNLIRFNGSNLQNSGLDCSGSASSTSCTEDYANALNHDTSSSMYWSTPGNCDAIRLQSVHDENPMLLYWGTHDNESIQTPNLSVQELKTEITGDNDSLALMRSCSSSSSININPMCLHKMTPFLQQPDLILPEDNDDEPTAAATTTTSSGAPTPKHTPPPVPAPTPMVPSTCMGPTDLFEYQGKHLNTANPALLESTTNCQFAATIRADSNGTALGIGAIITVDNTKACCSLMQSPKSPIRHAPTNHVQPPLIKTINEDQIFLPNMNVFNQLYTAGKFTCSPNSRNAIHSQINRERLQGAAAQDQSNRTTINSIGMDATVNNTIVDGDSGEGNYVHGADDDTDLGILSTAAASHDHVVPAPLMWEGSIALNTADHHHVQQQTINRIPGWEIMGDTCSSMNNYPQFAFPEWCKHLLQGDL